MDETSLGYLNMVQYYKHFFTNIFLTNNLSTAKEINGFRLNGMKIMSHCISGGKQVIKFANMSNRGQVKNETMIK